MVLTSEIVVSPFIYIRFWKRHITNTRTETFAPQVDYHLINVS